MASFSAQIDTTKCTAGEPALKLSTSTTRHEKSNRPPIPAITQYLPILPKRVEIKSKGRTQSHRPTRGKPQSSKAGPRLQPRPKPLESLRKCQIRLCPLINCTLRSHREFKPRTPQTSLSPSRANGSDENITKSDGVKKESTHPPSTLTIYFSVRGIDGLPALPLDGLEEPIFRELFHDFFSYHHEKIRKLLYPPPISPEQRLVMSESKQRSLRTALSAPVYCLHYIAAAHHQVVFRRGYRRPDRNTVILHGKVMQLLRAKLQHHDLTEIRDVVLVIFTLVMFDIAVGQTRSLAAHRKGIHFLINSCGGIHHMGDAIPFVLTLDRIISIMTSAPPLYRPPAKFLVRKPVSIPVRYGTFWEDLSGHSLMDQEIYMYCVDTCRAIEIVEHEKWTFDPNDTCNADSSNIHYFFFYRECIVNKFVELNVTTAQHQTLSRCILLTTKIVEYVTLMDNYIVVLPITLADRFREIMCAASAEIKWSQHADILRWILFVVTCMSDPWDHRPWALALMRRQLDEYYHSKFWPRDWRQIELANVRQFVWSDTRFNPDFVKTCNELSMDSPSFSVESSVEQ